MIHTFGDSHSGGNWGITNGIRPQYVHPRLCYSFGKDQDTLLKPDHGIKEGDAVLFCLGEIDCRNHIFKHVTPELPPEKMVRDIVDNYLKAIKKNVDLLPVVDVLVLSVTPTAYIEDVSKYVGYPRCDTHENRKYYTLLFNWFIAEKCQEYCYTFVDVFTDYLSDSGFLNTQYSFDGVHITDPVFITRKLRMLGVLPDH